MRVIVKCSVYIYAFKAEDLLDTAMTYTLFEFAKEQAAELMEDQPDAPVQVD